MARNWTIAGISEETRAAVSAAAQEAGVPVGAWIEQALRHALEQGLEPGVSLEEVVAQFRQVVSDELQPMQQTLVRLETAVTVSGLIDGSSPVSLVRGRMRQRRGR